MASERRNDIGSKVLISVVVLLTVTIMGFSIGTASNAMAKAQGNEVAIGKMQTYQSVMQEDVREIRKDVKTILNKL